MRLKHLSLLGIMPILVGGCRAPGQISADVKLTAPSGLREITIIAKGIE